MTLMNLRSGVRRVVGQVEEQTDVVHGTVLLKVRLKEPRCLHVHLEEGQKNREQNAVRSVTVAACLSMII